MNHPLPPSRPHTPSSSSDDSEDHLTLATIRNLLLYTSPHRIQLRKQVLAPSSTSVAATRAIASSRQLSSLSSFSTPPLTPTLIRGSETTPLSAFSPLPESGKNIDAPSQCNNNKKERPHDSLQTSSSTLYGHDNGNACDSKSGAILAHHIAFATTELDERPPWEKDGAACESALPVKAVPPPITITTTAGLEDLVRVVWPHVDMPRCLAGDTSYIQTLIVQRQDEVAEVNALAAEVELTNAQVESLHASKSRLEVLLTHLASITGATAVPATTADVDRAVDRGRAPAWVLLSDSAAGGHSTSRAKTDPQGLAAPSWHTYLALRDELDQARSTVAARDVAMARLEAEVVAANQARTVAVAAAVSDAAVAIAAAEFSATARVSATESGAATQVEAAAAALAVAEQAGAQAREQVTTLKGELESARNTSREWETAAAEATGQVAELRDRAAGLETDRVQLTQTLTVESAALASAIEKIGVLETAVAAERASAAAAVCKHRELEAQWATDQQALDERHTAEVAARTALEAAHAQTVSELHLEGETKLHGARVEHQVRFDATQAQLASMTAQVQRMEAAATAAAHAHSQALESAAAAAAAADAQLTLTQSELQAVTAAATGAQERLVARDLVVAQLQERIEALAKLHSDARSQLDLALADATAAAERIAVLTLEVEQKSAAQTRAEHQVIELKQALAASRQECSVAAADISGLRTQVTALGSRVQDQSSKLVAETNTGHSLVHKISELEEAARVSEAARMQVVADYEMLRGLQTAAEAALRAARKEAEISAESHRASHAAAIKRGDDMEQLAVAKAAEYAAADRDRAMFAAAHHAVQAHLKALSDMHRDVVAQLAASETRGAALKQTVAEYEQLGASVSLAAVQAAASRGELEGARRKVAALELELEGTKAKAHEWEQAMHSWANERDQCYRMMGAMRAQVAFWRNRTDGSISSSSASLARAAAGPKSS